MSSQSLNCYPWKQEDYLRYYNRTWGDPRYIGSWRKDHVYRLRQAVNLHVGNSSLDVGCGTGHLYTLLRKKSCYTGIDNSCWQIKYAKQCFPNVNFKVADLYDMNNIESADTVYCLSVLLHLPEFFKPLTCLWDKADKALVFNMFIADKTHVEYDKSTPDLLYSYLSRVDLEYYCSVLPGIEDLEYYWCGSVDPEGTNFVLVRISR